MERLRDVLVASTGVRVPASGEDTATLAAAGVGIGLWTELVRALHHQIKVQDVEMVSDHLREQGNYQESKDDISA